MASAVIDALVKERTDLEGKLRSLQQEWDGKVFDDEAKQRWNDLNSGIEEYTAKIELHQRDERIAEIKDAAKDKTRTEPGFQIRNPGRVSDDQIYDTSTLRSELIDPQGAAREMNDRAKYAIEKMSPPHPGANLEDAQTHLEHMRTADDSGLLSRHLLVTGNPVYKRAFGKLLSGSMLNQDEALAVDKARALSLTGTSGGFAVPFELDPSIIPTSNLAINPYRSLARVIQISVDEWRGVSSAGITAAYAAEATAATDASPTLAQPTISTEKARAFVPFSIEVGQDWGSLQSEMAGLLSDAKDELEATKFTTGTGTNEPFGVITGATTVFTAAATNAITLADIYNWQAALGPRFRPRSAFVMNLAVANKIRQFDTAGGAGLWIDTMKSGLATTDVPTPGAYAANLLGRPAYESSAMSGTFTTGQLIGVYGDWNYFVIVDRVGMAIEVIPHLFDVTNNMPTGQRGLYAYWRNGSKVVDANAFRTLKLA